MAEIKPMTTLAATDNASLTIVPNVRIDTAKWSLKRQFCQLQDNYGPDITFSLQPIDLRKVEFNHTLEEHSFALRYNVV